MDIVSKKYKSTPQVQMLDIRGLLAREVQYNREQANDPVTGDA